MCVCVCWQTFRLITTRFIEVVSSRIFLLQQETCVRLLSLLSVHNYIPSFTNSDIQVQVSALQLKQLGITPEIIYTKVQLQLKSFLILRNRRGRVTSCPLRPPHFRVSASASHWTGGSVSPTASLRTMYVKVKVTLQQATKAQRCRGIALLFL